MKHHQNKNISLIQSDHYMGLPIQTRCGPLATDYLKRLYSCLNKALEEYPRVFAFRIDLRLPQWADSSDYIHDNLVMERFIESIKAKIRHNRSMAKRENKYAHESSVRYVWAREISENNKPHYHVAIMLNNDAYCTLGKFEIGRNNLFNRLTEAWASALALEIDEVIGLMEIPDNHAYLIRQIDQQAYDDFFYRASYLCKVATKQFGNGCHGFGSSRV